MILKTFTAIPAQVLLLLLSVCLTQAKPLNYLILLADDISASSLGCYGALNPHTSPNIDRLAREGVHFTNMYVSEACTSQKQCALLPVRNYTPDFSRSVMGVSVTTKPLMSAPSVWCTV